MSSPTVLFSVFAMTMANATIFSTVGLFARGIGLGEVQVGTIFASSAVLFFLTSSRWGSLADRRGRRPVIVTGLVGTAVSLFSFAGMCALKRTDIAPAVAFAALLAARVGYGLLAGGVQPAAIASMADVTADKERSIGAAFIGASVGLGSMVGPASAAVLVGFGFSVPLLAAGALAALAACLALAVMREGQGARPARPVEVGSPAKTLTPHLVLAFAMYFGFAVLQPTTAFYVQDRFAIGTTLAVQRAGLVSTAFAACAFVVQVFAVRAFNVGPRTLLSTGLVICALGIASCLVAPDFPWLLAAFGVAGCGYGLAQPGLFAAALLAGDSDRQGQVAGTLQAAMSAAWIVGPLVGTTVYAFSIKGPLLLATAAVVVAGAVLLVPGQRK